MKQLWISVVVATALVAGCHERPQHVDGTVTPVEEDHTGHDHAPDEPHVSEEPAANAMPAAGQGMTGSIIETMNSGNYTYALINTGQGAVWAAAPECTVAVGDVVTVNSPMAMKNFHSDTMNRDFETIYFASSFDKPQTDLAAGHTAAPAAQAPVEIEKAEGEQTVEAIFTQSSDLVGKEVTLRGKVVKYNSGIMGKNWLHLQDGTGSEGTNDLTITTDATVAVGDMVTVRGVLSADKDFGFGYKYDLIVEDATVTQD